MNQKFKLNSMLWRESDKIPPLLNPKTIQKADTSKAALTIYSHFAHYQTMKKFMIIGVKN
jgi:hypothetical protein